MMRKLICTIFGHKMPTGYGGDVPYLRVGGEATDGTGRRHLYMSGICPRCNEFYPIANVHVPERKKL